MDHVTLLLTNNPAAGVLERARNLQIPSFVFTMEQLNTGVVLDILQKQHIDFVVLAGFLRKVPVQIIQAFPERMVNIHPALLPRYGGKGMFGSAIHKAVLAAGETETGITIHYVSEEYDEGDIIFQAKTPVLPKDKVEDIERKIHLLEYKHYPEVIEDLINDLRAR
jgi:phosphoribosylglycinamide formyltransferase-1